jgi:methionyl-tRNA formyltransferase
MRFIFIGGTYRGFKVLSSLFEQKHFPVFAVILKEDEHEENKFSNKIVDLLIEYNIPFIIRRKIKNEDAEEITKLQCDFAIVCGWRSIINIDVLHSFKFGMVAAHDSLLPQHRGFAPINWGIINGEKKGGVTLFLLHEGETDSGFIISQQEVTIEFTDYAIDVYEKVVSTTVQLYENFIKNYQNNSIQLIEQDESKASYTCKRTPSDGKIEWNDSSTAIYNLIRALAPPYPKAFCYYNGIEYRIHKAEIGPNNLKNYVGRIPGRVINYSPSGIEVLCGKGTILITLWEQIELKIISSPYKDIKSIAVSLK